MLSKLPADTYQPLVRTFDAVEEDWRGAGRYKPLSVEVPKNIAWGRWGKAIKEPIVARGGDIQIIVVQDNNLENYFARRPDADFYRVTQAGISVCWWESEDGEEKLVKRELGEAKTPGAASDEPRPLGHVGLNRAV